MTSRARTHLPQSVSDKDTGCFQAASPHPRYLWGQAGRDRLLPMYVLLPLFTLFFGPYIDDNMVLSLRCFPIKKTENKSKKGQKRSENRENEVTDTNERGLTLMVGRPTAHGTSKSHKKFANRAYCTQ
ncbi:hypothetical protein M9H77_16392 [Catharanthus roseus]|uniref:Uncharacterized protein n=1 Tax=Catharanthus roseus TaxID=4058 RepID=A0ACC0B1N3_CATRO|nr:hypothetical protein M9H77_16392 [Catharanthus roseus]